MSICFRMAAGNADTLYRLAADSSLEAGSYIKPIQDLETAHRYDLIIAGADCLDGGAVLGPYLAGALKRPHFVSDTLEVRQDGTGFANITLPAVVSTTSSESDIMLAMDQAVGASFARIQVLSPG